ncbi:MAG: dodecin family protein [Pseudomonadota bacterium]
MDGSTYKIIELAGASETSWEEAAKSAIATAGETLRGQRIAEVIQQDVTIEGGKITSFRVRLNISFRYEEG